MKKILVVLMAAFTLFACTKKNENELFVYNWSEYIPDVSDSKVCFPITMLLIISLLKSWQA